MKPPENAYDLPPEESGWVPGDPLHVEPTVQGSYSHRALYDFRDDVERPEGNCSCPDAASWPHPKGGQTIVDGDEIGRLIAEERLAREESA